MLSIWCLIFQLIFLICTIWTKTRMIRAFIIEVWKQVFLLWFNDIFKMFNMIWLKIPMFYLGVHLEALEKRIFIWSSIIRLRPLKIHFSNIKSSAIFQVRYTYNRSFLAEKVSNSSLKIVSNQTATRDIPPSLNSK